VGTVANALFTTSALNSWPSTILDEGLQAGTSGSKLILENHRFSAKNNVKNFEKTKIVFFAPSFSTTSALFKPLF
jgi:hypothetical protein